MKRSSSPSRPLSAKVTGDAMKGTLVVLGGTVHRVIEVKKVKKDWRAE